VYVEISTAQAENLRINYVIRLQGTMQLCSDIWVYECGIPFP